MKKNLVRVLCALLSLLMLASVAVVAVNAAGENEIVNLYDESKAAVGTVTDSRDAAPTYNANYHSSAAIEVVAGDKITIGPVLDGQSWFLKGYNASGTAITGQVTPSACQKVDTICNNAVILTYTVPANVTSIRVTNSQMFYDSTLITKNRSFTKDEYFAYMDSKNINVDYLRPTNSTETLVNKFPVSDKTFLGRIGNDSSKPNKLIYEENDTYRSSEFITVQRGDVVYFAAASQSQGYHLSLADANGVGTTNVKAAYMVLYEDLGRGYAIYAYRMREGTGKVTVVVGKGTYDDGIAFATINQPFTGEKYRETFNIELKSEVDTSSPLNGLTGLFMGDSISYGSGDTSSYLTFSNGRAWAGRISAWTGLQATNASIGGAKASYISGDDTAKWLFNQHTAHVGKKFDIIVMQGGVNDARHVRTIGEAKPVDTDPSVLSAPATLTTYIGGLQWLFHNITEKFPDSTLFFILNHRLDGHDKGNAKNMGPYFEAARELCQMYGINVIDLYNNKELNDKLETTTTKYLPDTLHLNAAGYDIVTPYIISALEAEMKKEEETTPAETTTAQPEETTPAETTTLAGVTEPATVEKGCGSSVGTGIALAMMITLAGTVALRKRK